MRCAHDVGEMCEPHSEWIVLGVSLVRPDSFEHKLRLSGREAVERGGQESYSGGTKSGREMVRTWTARTYVVFRLVTSTALILAHDFFCLISLLLADNLRQSASVRVPGVLAFINHRR
jgi:hypothetical protein